MAAPKGNCNASGRHTGVGTAKSRRQSSVSRAKRKVAGKPAHTRSSHAISTRCK